jgi:hypothetical protein
MNSYKKKFGELFGQLSVTVNIPGIDIKIADSRQRITEYRATTNKGYEPVEFYLWVGKKRSRVYKVELEYDYNKFEEEDCRWKHVKAGKKTKVSFKLKPVPLKRSPTGKEPVTGEEPEKVKSQYLEPKKNFILFALEQRYGMFAEEFAGDPVQFVQPYKDISSFEVGIGFSSAYHFSVRYGKNFNLLISEPNWGEEDINESFDYNMSEIGVDFVMSGHLQSYDPNSSVLKFGYKNLKIEHIDYWGSEISSRYHLFWGGYFFNIRSNKRNSLYIQLGGGGSLGFSKIEFYSDYYGWISPDFNCGGFFFAGEIGLSLNSRVEICFGASYEKVTSKIDKDKMSESYPWLPEDLKESITLSKIFMRLTFRL